MPTLRLQPDMGLGETDDPRGTSINVAKDFTGPPRVGRGPLDIPSKYAQ